MLSENTTIKDLGLFSNAFANFTVLEKLSAAAAQTGVSGDGLQTISFAVTSG